jgi:hypothetical protein
METFQDRESITARVCGFKIKITSLSYSVSHLVHPLEGP